MNLIDRGKRQLACFFLYEDEARRVVRDEQVANLFSLLVDHDVRGSFEGLQFHESDPDTCALCSIDGQPVWPEPMRVGMIEALSLSAVTARPLPVNPGSRVEVVVWGPCVRVTFLVRKDPPPAPALQQPQPVEPPS